MKIYSFLSLACLAIAALCVVSCSSSLKVTTDYDKSANFSQYRTFRLDTTQISRKINQLNENRILNAVRSEMQKKGFAESANADLVVHTSAIFKQQQSVSSSTDFYGAYGYGGFYRPYGWGVGIAPSSYTTYNVQNYTNGSLIISIADAGKKTLVWEGIGNKDLDNTVKDPDTKIAQAVAAILASFPPGR